jgi:pimeloyl-ACP methyl ester carboxylesterase
VDQRTFAPRVRIPVLMVNGRYDWAFPVGTSQRPFFRMLGTPAADKTHVLLESGHWELSTERIRIILEWLDQRQS